jgi:hypothetical protein
VLGPAHSLMRARVGLGLQTLTVRLDRAHDVDIELMDGDTLRGLVFFRLSDCAREWSLAGELRARFTLEPHGDLALTITYGKQCRPGLFSHHAPC